MPGKVTSTKAQREVYQRESAFNGSLISLYLLLGRGEGVDKRV